MAVILIRSMIAKVNLAQSLRGCCQNGTFISSFCFRTVDAAAAVGSKFNGVRFVFEDNMAMSNGDNNNNNNHKMNEKTNAYCLYLENSLQIMIESMDCRS